MAPCPCPHPLADRPRKNLAVSADTPLQEEAGEDKLKELVAGLKGGDFLAADEELDPPDLVSVEDFLAEQGLTALAA